MEHELSIDSGPVVDRELTEILGREVASPTDTIGELFKSAITNRDVAALKSLVIDQYPSVVWGSRFNELLDEDRSWAITAIQS